MISICIPIFNNDVTQLVQTLEQQLKITGKEGEIILMDDASNQPFRDVNQKLSSELTTYHQLSENIGRAAIRNQLAQTARYDHLLFLDSDSIIQQEDFLQKYLANKNEGVVYGGTTYQAERLQARQLLHFTYGRTREAKKVAEREQAPYRTFKTNNFLVKRAVLLEIPFEERLTSYGHEDTLFSIALRQHQVPVRHIDNPVVHGELESDEVFLQKSKGAVKNLYHIYGQQLIDRQSLAAEVLLIKWFEMLRKIGLLGITRVTLQLFQDGWERNLAHFSGSGLWRFNALKLLYLLQFHHQRQ